MSATIPLPVRAELRPHDMFGRAWAAPAPIPTQPIGVAALLTACQRWLRDLRATWRDRRQIRATRLALMKLDDATLRDIGFARARSNRWPPKRTAASRSRARACSRRPARRDTEDRRRAALGHNGEPITG